MGAEKAQAEQSQLFEKRIDERYLTSSQLAECLGLSVHTVRAWRKLRIITPMKFGRSVRWLLEDVLKELAIRNQLK